MKLSDNHSDDQYVVGSPYWIAPEIINMASPTSACDIWYVINDILPLLGVDNHILKSSFAFVNVGVLGVRRSNFSPESHRIFT